MDIVKEFEGKYFTFILGEVNKNLNYKAHTYEMRYKDDGTFYGWVDLFNKGKESWIRVSDKVREVHFKSAIDTGALQDEYRKCFGVEPIDLRHRVNESKYFYYGIYVDPYGVHRIDSFDIYRKDSGNNVGRIRYGDFGKLTNPEVNLTFTLNSELIVDIWEFIGRFKLIFDERKLKK